MVRLLASIGLLAATATHGISVTPLEKVTNLLESLKEEVEKEGQEEAKTYDEFACFCKDKSDSTSSAITSGQDTIDVLSASLGDSTALKQTKLSELQEKKGEQEQLKRSVSETQVSLEKAKAAYEASDADLVKAISSLAGAIKTLGKSKPSSSSEGLLAVRQTVKKTLALAQAMKLLDAPPSWHSANAAVALLQERMERSAVDPQDADYKFHSQGIVQILTKLEEDFKGKKSEADGEWAKTKSTLESTLADLNSQLELTAAAIVDLTTGIDTLTSEIAKTRGSLVEAQSTLKEDQLYIEDLTKLCEERAKEWDQRSQARKGELEALTEALSTLKGKVAETESVNKRALIQQAAQIDDAAEGPVSFLQSKEVRAHASTLLERVRSAQQQKQMMMQRNVVALLRKEGGRLHSAALSNMAVSVTSNPFGKVKDLLQGLIERLLEEATTEAAKKGFCDSEVGKATQDRTFRYESVTKINAEMRQLEAKRDSMTAEVADLQAALEDLTAALKEATKVRAQEKSENEASVKTATEGLQAVKSAIGVLKKFYKQAAKAMLIQASPVEKDLPSASKGAYKGQQEASSGIIGLLEVIQSDFERTVESTTKAEAKAAAEFVKFERTSKADIASKTTKVQLLQQDLAANLGKLAVKKKDMTSNMNLLDGALRELEELKPVCIDNGMSYEERALKRDEEIAALKKAVCIMDPEGLEEICK